MLIYTCISTHGYGHAARQAAVLKEIKRRQPLWRIVISTGIKKEVLNLFMKGLEFEYHQLQWDVGVVQSNALLVDLDSTLRSLDDLSKSLPDQISNEAEWIRSQNEEVIMIADIPPSAFNLSKEVGAKLIWIGNFGWDDIYGELGVLFKEHTDKAIENYCEGDLLLRLPFSLPMKWGLPEINIGLTQDKPRNLNKKFDLILRREQRRKVIVAFGGIGYGIKPELFSYWPDFVFLIASTPTTKLLNYPDNVLHIPASCRVIDVLPFCSRHLGKPGYSSFCEAISQGVGLHVVNRESFAEAPALIEGLKKYAFHRLIDKESLQTGDWQLDMKLVPPTQQLINIDGAQDAAKEIIKFSS